MKTSKMVIYVIIFCVILSIIIGFSVEVKENYYQKKNINRINNVEENFNDEEINEQNFNDEEINEQNFNDEEINGQNFNDKEINEENFNDEEIKDNESNNEQDFQIANTLEENNIEENNNFPEPSYFSGSLEGAPI